MSGSKRKGRASPDIVEFDEDDHESPQRGRRMDQDRDTSQIHRRSNSVHDDYMTEERDSRRFRGGNPRPGGGGYRQPGSELRTHADYERQYSPGYYRQGPSSSRVPYRSSRSPDAYGRPAEGAGWYDGREGWARPRPGCYEDYGPPKYNDDYYGFDSDMQDSRSGGRPLQRRSPAPQVSSRKGVKFETNMEAPTKRPIQLDRYVTSHVTILLLNSGA